MSMDDVYIRAQELSSGLAEFNDDLRAKMDEVDRSHAHVSPLWDDSMRRDYDRKWIPLQDEMKRYNQQIGPQYVNFLIDRLRHLKSYLHGS
jgi:hypothetical protein